MAAGLGIVPFTQPISNVVYGPDNMPTDQYTYSFQGKNYPTWAGAEQAYQQLAAPYYDAAGQPINQSGGQYWYNGQPYSSYAGAQQAMQTPAPQPAPQAAPAQPAPQAAPTPPAAVSNLGQTYNQAQQAAGQQYGNVTGAYQQAIAGFGAPGEDVLQKAYGQLGGQVAGTLGYGGTPWGIAAPAAQAIKDMYTQVSGGLSQQLIGAGLGNTTVQGQMQRGPTLDAAKAYAGLGAQLAQTYAGYQANLGLSALGQQGQVIGANLQGQIQSQLQNQQNVAASGRLGQQIAGQGWLQSQQLAAQQSSLAQQLAAQQSLQNQRYQLEQQAYRNQLAAQQQYGVLPRQGGGGGGGGYGGVVGGGGPIGGYHSPMSGFGPNPLSGGVTSGLIGGAPSFDTFGSYTTGGGGGLVPYDTGNDWGQPSGAGSVGGDFGTPAPDVGGGSFEPDQSAGLPADLGALAGGYGEVGGGVGVGGGYGGGDTSGYGGGDTGMASTPDYSAAVDTSGLSWDTGDSGYG